MDNTEDRVDKIIIEDKSFKEELLDRIELIEEGEEFAIKMTKKDYMIVAIIALLCLAFVIGGGVSE